MATVWTSVPARPQTIFGSNGSSSCRHILSQPVRPLRQKVSGCSCQAAKGFAPSGKAGSKVRSLLRHCFTCMHANSQHVIRNVSDYFKPAIFLLQKNKRKLDSNWISVGSLAEFPVTCLPATMLIQSVHAQLQYLLMGCRQALTQGQTPFVYDRVSSIGNLQ